MIKIQAYYIHETDEGIFYRELLQRFKTMGMDVDDNFAKQARRKDT